MNPKKKPSFQIIFEILLFLKNKKKVKKQSKKVKK